MKAFDNTIASNLVSIVRQEFDPVSFASEAKMSPKMASLMTMVKEGQTPTNQQIKQASDEFIKYLDNKISNLGDVVSKLNSALSVLPEGSNLMAEIKLLAMKATNQRNGCRLVKSKAKPLFDSLLK